MTEHLRAGVVGAGNMGRHHARVYASQRGSELVGVADADAERAASVAAEYDATAMGTDALLDVVDLVTVAVPTPYHEAVANRAVDRGVATLVEKPLAESVAAGRRLVDAADDAGVPLAVGHVERFNPAVRELLDLVDPESVVAVDARRLGPPRTGGSDDVVRDLMIHDLDVLLALLGDGDVVGAETTADGQYAAATLRFGADTVGTLTASRVTQQKVRRLSVTTRESRVVVDYVDQSVHIHRVSEPSYVEASEGIRHRDATVVERPTVESGEPLRGELAAFTEAVRTGSRPPVSGADGLRALRLAEAVTAASQRDAVRASAEVQR